MFSYITGRLGRCLDDVEGTSTVEYALLLALIVGTCLVAVSMLGDRVMHTFDYLQPPESAQWGSGS